MFRRAFTDTLQQASGPGGIVFFLFSLLAPPAAVWFSQGRQAVTWDSAYIALSGFGAAAIVLLLYNLCATPARVAREQAGAFEADLNSVKAQMASLQERPRIDLQIDSIGINSNATPTGFPVLVVASIRNVGNRPSALENWAVDVVPLQGDEIRLNIVHAAQGVNIVNQAGFASAYAARDEIYEKTLEPISVGGFKRGFIAAYSGNPRVGGLVNGDIIRVSCDDTHGVRWEAVRAVGEVPTDITPPWYPGMSG